MLIYITIFSYISRFRYQSGAFRSFHARASSRWQRVSRSIDGQKFQKRLSGREANRGGGKDHGAHSDPCSSYTRRRTSRTKLQRRPVQGVPKAEAKAAGEVPAERKGMGRPGQTVVDSFAPASGRQQTSGRRVGERFIISLRLSFHVSAFNNDGSFICFFCLWGKGKPRSVNDRGTVK